MDNKSRMKELLKISSPIILEQICITIMGLVNQIMVARQIGEHAVSAVGLIDSISNIMISVFAALTTGGTIIVAQYIGRKNTLEAKKAGAQALILAVVMSFFIFVFFTVFKLNVLDFLLKGAENDADYPLVYNAAFDFFTIIIFSFPILAITQTMFGILRGSGNTGIPMTITLIMNVFNIVLGFLLIYPWHINLFGGLSLSSQGFGIKGAALALTLARCTGMILSIIYTVFFDKTVRLNKLQYFKLNFKTQKTVLEIGIPTSIESSLFQVGRLITQLFIVGMGNAAMSANSISGTVLGFVNVPGNAFCTGVMILVGQKIGREEFDDVDKTTLFAVKAGAFLFLIICAILAPLAGTIANIYDTGPEATLYVKNILLMGLAATPILWPASFITPAALRATGDVKYTMITAILSMTFSRILLAYVIGVLLNVGVYGIWYAMFVDWGVRSILFLLRLKKGAWRKRYAISEQNNC